MIGLLWLGKSSIDTVPYMKEVRAGQYRMMAQ